LTFTVPGPPRPKKRARTSFFDKRGRLRVHPATGKPNPVTYTPKQTVAYEAAVRLYALAARNRLKTPWPLDAHYRVCIVQYQCQAKPDRDNVRKAVLDACEGKRRKGVWIKTPILWDNDSQVRADGPGETYILPRGDAYRNAERLEVIVEVLP